MLVDGKVGYHEGRLPGVDAPKFRNRPVELPSTTSRRDALHAGLVGAGA